MISLCLGRVRKETFHTSYPAFHFPKEKGCPGLRQTYDGKRGSNNDHLKVIPAAGGKTAELWQCQTCVTIIQGTSFSQQTTTQSRIRLEILISSKEMENPQRTLWTDTKAEIFLDVKDIIL
ncbi:hypothetical protein Tco_1143068 [Tanacetum coccineum]